MSLTDAEQTAGEQPAGSLWYADLGWLGDPAQGPVAGVLIRTDGQLISAVEVGVAPPPEAERLPGLLLPGLVNAHSHAFHRALRGRTQGGKGDFWSWREQMYAVAARLQPDTYYALARAVYGEMALAGITTVAEFHYLHHDTGGVRYAEPNEMGHALVAAGAAAGVRVVLLDTCYLQSDVDGTPLDGTQLRFGDGDEDAWAERAADLRVPYYGAAIHSVRACPPSAIRAVSRWVADRNVPLHIHLSEQRRENEACEAVHGRTPARLCADCGVLGTMATAVHATHLLDGDVSLLGGTGTNVCFCPTTERDLADGIGPSAALRDAGAGLCVGSDSHAMIDLFEEARAVELNTRLVTERRGHHPPAELLAAAAAGGARAVGLDGGRIAPGAPADFVAVSLDSVRLAGSAVDDPLAAVTFAGTASDVSHVVAAGRLVVADGGHLLMDVPRELTAAIDAVS